MIYPASIQSSIYSGSAWDGLATGSVLAPVYTGTTEDRPYAANIVALFGSSIPAANGYVLGTESGDFIMTEDGDYIEITL